MMCVYVWELPVRLAHWLIFLSIVVLSFTGVYIGWPFISAPAEGSRVMGTMRLVHFITAYIFLFSVLFRIYWGFVGNKYARWKNFLPISKESRENFKQSLRYYFWLRFKPPLDIGHSTLAGTAYIVLYFCFLLVISTGFALYSQPYLSGIWYKLFGWTLATLGPQTIRLVHHLCMYIFICFFIHHVYSAILWSVVTKNGITDSIFSGYKYLELSEHGK